MKQLKTKSHPRWQHISVVIPEETYRLIVDIAQAHQISKNRLIREVLNDWAATQLEKYDLHGYPRIFE